MIGPECSLKGPNKYYSKEITTNKWKESGKFIKT